MAKPLIVVLVPAMPIPLRPRVESTLASRSFSSLSSLVAPTSLWSMPAILEWLTFLDLVLFCEVAKVTGPVVKQYISRSFHCFDSRHLGIQVTSLDKANNKASSTNDTINTVALGEESLQTKRQRRDADVLGLERRIAKKIVLTSSEMKVATLRTLSLGHQWECQQELVTLLFAHATCIQRLEICFSAEGGLTSFHRICLQRFPKLKSLDLVGSFVPLQQLKPPPDWDGFYKRNPTITELSYRFDCSKAYEPFIPFPSSIY